MPGTEAVSPSILRRQAEVGPRMRAHKEWELKFGLKKPSLAGNCSISYTLPILLRVGLPRRLPGQHKSPSRPRVRGRG